MSPVTFILVGLFIFFIIMLFSTIRIVPQKSAFLVERLGKYRETLSAGFHILIPFIDKIAYKHSLKEQAIDVESQICITQDNIAGSKQGKAQHIHVVLFPFPGDRIAS